MQNATVEDLNTKAARGLDKALFAKLATGDWIGRRQDLLITGKTGTGNWLACALGHLAEYDLQDQQVTGRSAHRRSSFQGARLR
jgi:DNA replication protein DnaC